MREKEVRVPHFRNILITSAGRRVELLQAFQAQVAALIPGHRVHAVDCLPALSAACHIADSSSSSPRVTDEGYPAFLLDYCLRHQIGLVVPTIDTELAVLAACREQFNAHGIHIVISSPELVAQCRDKRKTGTLFGAHGIRYPAIYRRDDMRFPCFAKPITGSSSVDARIIRGPESLPAELLQDPLIMFMELIDKTYAEYTVDTYYDRESRLQCLVPRKRLEVRAGEVSKGVTRRLALYDFLLERLKRFPGAVGCLTIQVFVDEAADDYVGLEINPRFGGGFPLSYAAGANFPGWLIREYLLGENIGFFDDWVRNLLMLRYDAKVLVRDAT